MIIVFIIKPFKKRTSFRLSSKQFNLVRCKTISESIGGTTKMDPNKSSKRSFRR